MAFKEFSNFHFVFLGGEVEGGKTILGGTVGVCLVFQQHLTHLTEALLTRKVQWCETVLWVASWGWMGGGEK